MPRQEEVASWCRPPFWLNAVERILDGGAEPVDDQIDIACGCDIRWCEKDMIAAATVDGPSRRVTCQAKVKSRLLDPMMQPKVGIERSFAGSVFDQLNRLEKAAASYVAHVPVVAKPFGQLPFQN